MSKHDPRVDMYIEKSGSFAKPILNHLRQLVHRACPEIEETIKWSMPFFLYKGMVCHMAAFKQHCALGFWNSKMVLGEDIAAAEGSGMGHFGRITALKDLPSDKVLLGYFRKAVELNVAGVKKPEPARPKVKREIIVPDDLQKELRKNARARATFENFSPSHKREYVDWITEAKREETRARRLATTLELLAKGKPRNWKYENC